MQPPAQSLKTPSYILWPHVMARGQGGWPGVAVLSIDTHRHGHAPLPQTRMSSHQMPLTHQRKLTLSLHSLCSPHTPCFLPLSLLFTNFWSALDAVPVPMCYRLGNRDRCSELPTLYKKEVENRIVLVMWGARWWGAGSEETERRPTPSRTACGNS